MTDTEAARHVVTISCASLTYSSSQHPASIFSTERRWLFSGKELIVLSASFPVDHFRPCKLPERQTIATPCRSCNATPIWQTQFFETQKTTATEAAVF